MAKSFLLPPELQTLQIPAGLHVAAAELSTRIIAGSRSSEQPVFIHACGIPGAGKTTYAAQYLSAHEDFILLGFDQVMESLPGYQEALRSIGAAQAFSRWELPARAIGYRVLEKALLENKNIFFDHGAAHRAHPMLLHNIKLRGYQVEVHYVHCEADVAERRIKAREEKGGRHTPVTLITERQRLLNELLPYYTKLSDTFIRIDT